MTGATKEQSIHLPFMISPIVMIPDGLPVSQESLFLSEFVIQHCKYFKHVVDLGCGSGLLSLLLAASEQQPQVIGLDIQGNLIESARRNAAFNQFESRITFQHADLRIRANLPVEYSQDLVIANPPFRKLNTGRISPKAERSVSCHEITGALSDFVHAASLVLKNKGYFAVVILPERLLELLMLLENRRLHASVIRFVHHDPDSPANAALVIARRDGRGGLVIKPPLIFGYGNTTQ